MLIGVFIHLILDSVAGGILWLYPFSDLSYALIKVPSRYSFWVLNYVFHWVFYLEIFLVLTALYLLIGDFLKDRGWK